MASYNMNRLSTFRSASVHDLFLHEMNIINHIMKLNAAQVLISYHGYGAQISPAIASHPCLPISSRLSVDREG